jgi:hypothetical protein
MLGLAHILFLWRGPNGLDGILYADLALLDVKRPELSWRYLHVALLAASGRLCGDLAVGAGAYSLLTYSLSVVLLGALAWNGSPGAALLAGALGATCPVFADAATVPYCDLPAVAFSAAALVAAENAVRRASVGLALTTGALMLVALRSKETAICVAPALAWVALSRRQPVRNRLVAAFLAGVALALVASLLVDWAMVGDPLWALRPSAVDSYLAFNTRPHDRSFAGGTLVEDLSRRWLFPYSVVCFAGMVRATKHPRWGALSIWASASALFHGWSLAVSDFSASERYVLPILYPLLPLGGAWLQETWMQSRDQEPGAVRRTLAFLTAAACLGAMGLYFAPHFLRKASHQLLPLCWVLVAAWGLSGKMLRPLMRVAAVGLCAWTAFSSIYSARQMALHAAETRKENRRLVAVLRDQSSGPIGVLAPGTTEIERIVRVYSYSAAWSFARVRPSDAWPATMLAEMKYAAMVETRGWRQITAFDRLAYGPLGLFVRVGE